MQDKEKNKKQPGILETVHMVNEKEKKNVCVPFFPDAQFPGSDPVCIGALCRCGQTILCYGSNRRIQRL